ncbi:phosphotransferase [Gluconacetobacter sacchari]|uniref:phosphotransferase n=1 Tax=Gluconacetobacter sacchari TaxID=92759 RepID=UPI0039B4658A
MPDTPARMPDIALLGDLGSTFVSIARDEAIDILKRFYGLTASVARLETEKDDTFRVTPACGDSLILKIANPAEDPAEIEAQAALLTFLERTAPHLPTPRVMAGREGAAIVTFQDRAGQTRRARVMTYLPGQPLDRLDAGAALRRDVGRMLGRLRLAMAAFDHPGCHRVLAWDVRHVTKLAPLLDHVHDQRRREALAEAMRRLTGLSQRIAGLRRQVVHNDFNRSNLIIRDDGGPRLGGIIDFGDIVHTAIAIDVSTAVVNQLPRTLDGAFRDDLFRDARDVVRGYLAAADLDDEELRLIPHLAMARIVVRSLISLYRAALLPHNARYILRNTEPGWAQLDWLLKRDPDRLSARFLSDLRHRGPST